MVKGIMKARRHEKAHWLCAIGLRLLSNGKAQTAMEARKMIHPLRNKSVAELQAIYKEGK